ncbi:MAG TPA: argininosuccinate synthase [Elusimicrobia bacterium]|nr:MAG: argininosuccinate synthase [Elusimicrobia bacterium RIFOXYA12_FULL_49_49]OGS08724.1 MAG: argininosuccinate synthase [Elusimicrobia bacterium RIFOXYA1_FULL_47_7]OGS16219.1 MAG: argininosuccinate synthase [Elusimicrobia bacterium RIFOXYA2_FULL_47_53]OGS26581.1 MAG: argininosuccinate synthase [Elusimicrobia bacterium RIFOXYB12_FULL_50_12]OGS31374.1 MAG: argininosuccinate synthase [Elusimicrobia bacterium RIFOXYB2_FULL_46_23]HBU69521.1 argininosuccinate synthase [Elusimicrobiota bacterium]
MENIKTVVVAYSGGLDTSIILRWLKEKYRCRVIACAIDVGQGRELKPLRKKALSTGADKVYIIDAKKEFVTDYIFPALKAGAVYEEKYLLGTSLARPLIAEKIIEIAKKEKADAVCHGATGKGNDQVRFELTFKALMPDVKIIAPWREWEFKSREDEIDYALKHNIPIPVSKEKPYSSDANLLHISYEGGVLEDLENEYDESMFQMTVSPQKAPNRPEYVEIEFVKGIPVALNGKKTGPLELFEKLNKIAGRNGVGRVDLVENRLVGMKSRGVYETPAGTVLDFALRELEMLTLDRDTKHYKELVSVKYAELAYYGLWFTPLRESLDAFVNESMKTCSGAVKLKLYKGNIIVSSRKSKHSLYWEKLATFGEEDIYNQKDAEGFINLFGLPLKVKAIINGKNRSK